MIDPIIRTELIDNVLRAHWPCKQCVLIAPAERLWASQIVDQLSTTSWTFVPLLKLLLDDVDHSLVEVSFLLLGTASAASLRIASHAFADRLLRASHLPAIPVKVQVQVPVLAVRGASASALIQLHELLLVCERVRAELLCLLARTLLVLLLLHADDVLRLLISHVALMHVGWLYGDSLHARILLRNIVTRLRRHVEDRWRL